MPSRTGDRRIIDLFDQAVDLPVAERADWARNNCSDDPVLLERLLRLLHADTLSDAPLAAVVEVGVRGLEFPDRDWQGRQIGPWRVCREIGVGGMGSVWLAERSDDEYQRQVAIKLIRGFPDSDSLQRLRVERQILADLDHPNIAGLLDGGSTEEGQPYLVMEFIDGQPINDWCAKRALSPRARTELMIKVVRAVHFAHQHLVIHRDIKPGNVLVTDDGTPKLLDFGIAKLVDVGELPEHQTQVRYYTPHYSSPEQIEGRAVSTLSDVYSLGRLLAEVLQAGRPDQALPREPAAVIARATAAEPADRYFSAGALAADLQRWLDGRAVEALAKRRGYRLYRFIARHRLAAATTLLALLVTTGLVWRVVVESEQARVAAINANQTLTFLTDLIASARPEHAQGREVTVAEVLERGAVQLEQGDISAPLQSNIATTLASAWLALDDFPRAAPLFRSAADAAARAGDKAGQLRALAKYLVAQTRAGQVHASEVVAVAERLRADLERLSADDPALRADVLNDWAVWANDAGRVDEARQVLLQVIDLRKALGDEAALAAAENNLALAERYLGNFAAALALSEQSLARKRNVLGPDHPSTLLGLRALAIHASLAGEYARADAALDELLAQRVRLFGADNPVLAADYNERGNAVHDAGEYARAIELYQRALKLDAELEGAPGRHIYLNNLAAAHEDRGDYAGAERPLLESIQLREDRFGSDHANTLRVQHNLARLRTLQGNLGEAHQIATTTLQQRDRVLGPEHSDTRYSRLLLSWIDWLDAPPQQRQPDDVIEAAERLLADTPPTSLRGLAARTLLARVLREAGRLDQARAQLIAIIDDFHTSFGLDYPKAAELELELARIDLAQGQNQAVSQRLEHAAPILVLTLAPDAPALQLLDCLRKRDPASSCN